MIPSSLIIGTEKACAERAWTWVDSVMGHQSQHLQLGEAVERRELQLWYRMCLLLPFMAELSQLSVRCRLEIKYPSGWELPWIGGTSREVFLQERIVTVSIKIIILSGSFKNSPCLSTAGWSLKLSWTLLHSKIGNHHALRNNEYQQSKTNWDRSYG